MPDSLTIETVIAFNVTLIAAMASPGPALLYAIRSTLSGGRLVGLATGCGLGVMAAAWTLAALLGLDGLFRLFPWAYTGAKIVGALYLLWIAWTTWRDAAKPVSATPAPAAHAFLGGLMVNLANPKSVLFAAAVLVVIFPPGLGLAEKGLIVANHLAAEVLFYGAFALAMSTAAVSRRYLAAKKVLDRVAAGVLAGLGVRLLAER